MLALVEYPALRANSAEQTPHRRRCDLVLDASARFFHKGALRIAVAVVCCVPLIAVVRAQNSGQPQDNAQKPAETSQQKIERVTTTVVVHSEVKDDYLSDTASAGSLDGTPIKDAPLSISTGCSA